MKRLLMVAFHYPPASGTSGVQRALRFSSHLPEFGWEPIVLTANPRAYEHQSPDLVSEVPPEATVIRAQAWDTKRHLSVDGRYPTFMALPDRWCSWLIGGLPAGLSAIRRYKPDAIWSTYPIATAHRISALLAKWTGLPLLADFRDPMAQDGYPADPLVWRSFARVERMAIEAAAISTFTTPGAVGLYKARYPQYESRMQLLENGFDEAVFPHNTHELAPLNEKKLTLLHSGIVYPSERDPTSLFAALRSFRLNSPEYYSRLVVRFRAAIHNDLISALAKEYGVRDCVQILPAIPYAEAIREMQRADGLLILQASNCNIQIPAKFYEYLRAGPPIVVITDPIGDTASAARDAGVEAIANFESPSNIMSIIDRVFCGDTAKMLPNKSAVRAATRQSRTRMLADLLNKVVQV